MAEVQTTAMVGHAPAAEHEATALFLNPGGWVALAMIVVFALLIWQKVPSAIGKALDKKIDAIRGQLAEAESLRKEAEALKAEYAAKAATAEKEAAVRGLGLSTDAPLPSVIYMVASTNARVLVTTVDLIHK